MDEIPYFSQDKKYRCSFLRVNTQSFDYKLILSALSFWNPILGTNKQGLRLSRGSTPIQAFAYFKMSILSIFWGKCHTLIKAYTSRSSSAGAFEDPYLNQVNERVDQIPYFNQDKNYRCLSVYFLLWTREVWLDTTCSFERILIFINTTIESSE